MNLRYLVWIFFAAFISIGNAQINISNYIEEGRLLIQAKDYQGALQRFNTVINSKPHLPEGYFYRGIVKYELGDFLGAEADLSKCIEQKPGLSPAYLYRGSTYEKLMEFRKAFEDYDFALQIDPVNPYTYIYKAAALMGIEKFSEAELLINEALKLDNKLAFGYVNRAIARRFQKNYTGALEDCAMAIKINIFYSDAYLKRGLIFADLEKFDEAIADLNEALKLEPRNAFILFNRGMLFYKTEKLDEAMADFDSVLVYDPLNALTYFNRALLRTEKNDTRGAIEDYSNVLELKKNNIPSLFNRALLYTKMDRYNEAIADLTTAIEIYPDFAQAYSQRAQIKNHINDPIGARNDAAIANNLMNMLSNADSGFEIDSVYLNRIVSLDATFAIPGMLYNEADAFDHEPNSSIILTQESESTYLDNEMAMFLNRNPKRLIPSVRTATSKQATDSTLLRELTSISAIDRHSADDYFYMGLIHSLQQNYSTSIAYFDSCLAVNPSFYLAHFEKGNVQDQVVDFIFAEPDMRTFVGDSQLPPASDVLNKSSLDDYQDAIASYDACLAINEFPFAYYNRANIKCKNKFYYSAILDYSKSIELKPDFAAAYYNRGLTCIYLQIEKQGCNDLSKAGELGIKKAYTAIKRFCN